MRGCVTTVFSFSFRKGFYGNFATRDEGAEQKSEKEGSGAVCSAQGVLAGLVASTSEAHAWYTVRSESSLNF